MNDAAFQQLIEASSRRPLNAEEQRALAASLAQHPARRAVWEEETALNRLLHDLPDAPVPSNFTAQVLSALDREGQATRPPVLLPWWLRLRWLRPVAFGAAVAGVGLLSLQQHRTHQREQMARDVVMIATMARVPGGVEILQDFEAIRRLGLARPRADEDLLGLFQ